MIPQKSLSILRPYGEWDIKLKNDFTRLKLKIVSQVCIVVIVAVGLGLFIQFAFIDGIFQDSFAEGFLTFCRAVFRVSRDDAIYIYSALFRENKAFWLLIGFVFLLLLSFYISMSRFTRYFSEITRGVDKLAEGTEDTIELSPELDFVQQRLNAVNYALQKQARDAREAEQRKNDLVVYLAHDIKTPLTSVIGYLNLLAEAPDMPAEQRSKYTDITLEKAYRLEQLINEFFEITRFNLQTIVLDRDTVNLTYMLMQIADEFYPILTPQGKKTEVTAPEGLTVFGDADKLARVFNNILKNAAAYSDENSIIRIDARVAPFSAERLAAGTAIGPDPVPDPEKGSGSGHGPKAVSADSPSTASRIPPGGPAPLRSGGPASRSSALSRDIVRVTITNHGKTIPAKKLDSIFEKFYRLDSARSSGTGGAGLGLAIAREIVNAHDGRIYAESEGGVTRFTVELPQNGVRSAREL